MSQNITPEAISKICLSLIPLIEKTGYGLVQEMVRCGELELSSIINIIEQTPSLNQNHNLNRRVMRLVLDTELNSEMFKTHFVTLWKLQGSEVKDYKELVFKQLRLFTRFEPEKIIPCARMLISVLGREAFSKLIAKDAELAQACSLLLQDETELESLINKAFHDFIDSKNPKQILSLLESGSINKISQEQLKFLSENPEHFCLLLTKVVFLEQAKGVTDQLLQLDPQFILHAAQDSLRIAIEFPGRLRDMISMYDRILLLLLNRYGFCEFNRRYPPDACSTFLQEISRQQTRDGVDLHTYLICQLFGLAIELNDSKSCNEILTHYNNKSVLFIVAAQMGNKVILEQLLNVGIDINVSPIAASGGLTALDHACERGYLNVVKFLLEKGASTASREGLFLFSRASGKNRKEIRKLLIANKAFNLEERDKNGCTILHIACSKNDVEFVKELIEKGSDLLAENNKGETALYLGNSECALILLDAAEKKGLETLRNVLAAKTKSGSTALHEVDDSLELIKILLKYAQKIEEQTPGFLNSFINAKDEKGRISLLLHGIMDEKMINFLIEIGVDVNAKDKEGCTALHYAAKTQNIKMIKIVKLLIDKGADIKALDKKKRTPLHLSCKNLSRKKFTFDLVRADQNLETLTMKDCHGQTPLDILAAHGKVSFLQLFSELGKEEGAQKQIPFQQIALSSYIKGIERLNKKSQEHDEKIQRLNNRLEEVDKECSNEKDKKEIKQLKRIRIKIERKKRKTEKEKVVTRKQLKLLIKLPVEKLVQENLSLTLSVIKLTDKKDEQISTEIHKYICEKLKNDDEKVEFLQLSCQNEILFNYLLDPRTYADLIQQEVARLPEDQKLHFLALLPPLQIAEVIHKLDKEARDKLLQKEITCGFFDEHTLSGVEALARGKTQWLDKMNAENSENLLPYLEQLLKIIPLSFLAAAATSDLKDIVIAYLRVCNQSQIKVIIPQLSDEDFIQGIKELPHQSQFDCLRAALPSQKKCYLDKGVSSPLSKTCGEDYQRYLNDAKVRCAEVLAAFKENKQIQTEYEELEASLNKTLLNLTRDCQVLESFLKLLKKAYLENNQEAKAIKALKTEEKSLKNLKKTLRELKKLIKKLKAAAPAVKVTDETENAPDEFCDFTFTMAIMEDPVQTPYSAQNYERQPLADWVREHGTDPFTRKPMTVKDIKSNEALKQQIEAWKKSKEQQKAEKEEKGKEKVKD